MMKLPETFCWKKHSWEFHNLLKLRPVSLVLRLQLQSRFVLSHWQRFCCATAAAECNGIWNDFWVTTLKNTFWILIWDRITVTSKWELTYQKLRPQIRFCNNQESCSYITVKCYNIYYCTLRLWWLIEVSISSSPKLSICEVGLHWIRSSSCLWSLSATIWIASAHSSLWKHTHVSQNAAISYRNNIDSQIHQRLHK